jgi:hypothetical protein
VSGGREEEFLGFAYGVRDMPREVNTIIGEWHAEVMIRGNEGKGYIV